MRVCYFGTYRALYSRNQIIIEGLRRNGVSVMECHEQLWHGIDDRVQVASGGWMRPGFWLRALRAYLRLIWRYLKVEEHDILMVGYPGQFDVMIARLLSWLRGKPLVWDVFMSIYLIALERGIGSGSPRTVNVIRKFERFGLRLPNLLILDTEQYRQWFENVHGIAEDKVRLVPTGADDRVFTDRGQRHDLDGVFRVVYYGTYIPNHGVKHIIGAARILSSEADIQFELIGTGPDEAIARQLANGYGLTNIKFTDWLDKPALVSRIANADICLGSFGSSPQSLLTVQNKIYECMSMAKAIITGDSPAIRESMVGGKHIFVCDRESSRALAESIILLRDKPALRAQLARNASQLYAERFSLARNGRRVAAHLKEALAKMAKAG